jgi:predicted DNA-binding transcriptional regulator YafY
MPAKTTRRTLARQWELLKRLPSRGVGKTAAELTRELNAEGYVVSKRQVERDLWDLYEAFHLECNGASAPYGWKWPQGVSVDLPAMSLAEALSLSLVQETVQPMVPASLLSVLQPRFTLARQKLVSLASDSHVASWLQKVRSVLPTQPMLPAVLDSATLEAVHEALLMDRQLQVSYLAADAQEPLPMRFHPLGLVSRGHVSYLIATAWDYEDIRLYAMHRIRKAEVTDDPVERPDGFDIDDFIAQGALQFGGERSLRLEARVGSYLARVLSETPLAEDQKLEGDMLMATVKDTWQLRWWILSQGAEIEVLGPTSLRQRIAVELQSAAALYRD